MQRWLHLVLGVVYVALVATMSACAGDNGTDVDTTEAYRTTLSPQAVQNTDVTSDGSGSATIEWDGEVLTYAISVTSMDSVTAAHIHGPASANMTAPVRLTLFNPAEPTGPADGQLVSGTAAAGSPALAAGITMDDILGWIRVDSAFVMVHSTEYPNGEIRGIIVPD